LTKERALLVVEALISQYGSAFAMDGEKSVTECINNLLRGVPGKTLPSLSRNRWIDACRFSANLNLGHILLFFFFFAITLTPMNL